MFNLSSTPLPASSLCFAASISSTCYCFHLQSIKRPLLSPHIWGDKTKVDHVCISIYNIYPVPNLVTHSWAQCTPGSGEWILGPAAVPLHWNFNGKKRVSFHWKVVAFRPEILWSRELFHLSQQLQGSWTLLIFTFQLLFCHFRLDNDLLQWNWQLSSFWGGSFSSFS